VSSGEQYTDQVDTLQLSLFARAWWELIKRECPIDWSEMLPEIAFETPDRRLSPRPQPVLEFLPRLAAQASSCYREILDLLIEAKPGLRFGLTYEEADFGTDFLRQYGWVKMLGPDAYWHSEQLASGFLILGDNITYPQHWHEAEEIYLPICGDCEWYRQDTGWQLRTTGSLIHHASGVRHATRTTGDPMIALYLWRGGDLNQKPDIQ